jgi:hypothetical protein
MRKLAISGAIAFVTAASAPAYAAKFSCVFYGTGIPVTPACSIDSADASKQCSFKYPGNVTGTCYGGGNLIRCLFHTSPLPAAQELTISGPVPLLPAAGMLAGGVAEASTKLLLAGYKESQAAPEFDALCTVLP